MRHLFGGTNAPPIPETSGEASLSAQEIGMRLCEMRDACITMVAAVGDMANVLADLRRDQNDRLDKIAGLLETLNKNVGASLVEGAALRIRMGEVIGAVEAAEGVLRERGS